MGNIFTPEHLDQLVADTLPKDAKPGEKVVVLTTDANGATVAAGFKFEPHPDGAQWELKAAAHVEAGPDGKLHFSGGVGGAIRWQ